MPNFDDRCWRLVWVALVCNVPAFAADDSPPGGFSSLLTSRTQQTFGAIRDYVAEHPAASDRSAAVAWLFHTAPEWGWEADLIPLAEQMLAAKVTDPAVVAEARIVLALGRAQAGDVAGAVESLDGYLRALRLRNPFAAIDLSQSVAFRLQLRNDPAGAAAVYDRLTTAFFLNAEVRDAAEARKSRLDLLGKPAPTVSVSDVDGRTFSWDDHPGKVVLLDFWATNCRPCIEELPRLKQIARELQPRGLDLLGVSLDEDAETVKSFRDTQRLTWPLVLDQGKVAAEFRVRLIPCVMLVDRQRRIAAVDVRPMDLRWAALRLLDSKPQ